MRSLRHIGATICRAKIGQVNVGKGTCGSLLQQPPSLLTAVTQKSYSSLGLPPSTHDKDIMVSFISARRFLSRCTQVQAPRGVSRRGGVKFTENPEYTHKADKNKSPQYSIQTDPDTLKEYIKTSKRTEDDTPPEFPSDFEEFKRQQARRDQSRGSYRPKVDPKETSVLLFPGQGSQYVGMGRDAIGIPKVQELYNVASDILGYDLFDLCINGPKEKLDKTIHCQPAVFVASLAAVEKLKEENEMAIERCIATAGFSVGEFAALVFAGSLTYETGLEIVRERATAMQAASEEVASGMMTAFLGPDNKTKLACHTARLYCIKELGMDPESVDCVVANYLYPECKVLAGNVEALDFISHNSKEFGIRRTKNLPVSGAFHSKLMYPARAALEQALKNAEIQAPLISVHSNVDSYQYGSVKAIRKLLSQQVCAPVKWEQILHKIYERKKDMDFPNTYEVGPGRQLGAILKMTNSKAYQSYRPVGV